MEKKETKKAKEASEFDYRTIKSFADACKKLNIDPEQLPDVSMIPEEFRKAIINAYKLMIIYKAINDGWTPDWNNSDQYKYYPWFRVLGSGVGFSASGYLCTYSLTAVGSRLCTDNPKKTLYIAEQFVAEYKEYFLYL